MPVTWIWGNSGAGKTWLAKKIVKADPETIHMDGDVMRQLWPNLGFARSDRSENNVRIAHMAKALSDLGYTVVVSTICPFPELRDEVQKITGCRFIHCEGGETGYTEKHLGLKKAPEQSPSAEGGI